MAPRGLARHLVLVGLMATGKSTVGRRVAQALDRPFVDTDDLVAATTGRSVREIWRSDGEDEFRRLEAEALSGAVDGSEPSVIAAAGGVVVAEANRAVLAASDVLVVWLRARPDTLLRRVNAADDEHRPLLDGDAAGMLERMFADRSALYAQVADAVVDVDDLEVDRVVDAVLECSTAGGGA